ncbi:hypothetical protein DDE01_06980 [Desulfovibrio desulfuricans]|nr:hypothetical protein DDE01_06980 [Desulfovibrio desulfuricans]
MGYDVAKVMAQGGFTPGELNVARACLLPHGFEKGYESVEGRVAYMRRWLQGLRLVVLRCGEAIAAPEVAAGGHFEDGGAGVLIVLRA